MSKDTEREYATTVIKAILADLRWALIENYLPENVLINARSSVHELYQIEILEETGETLTINLRIKLSGGRKR